MGGPDTRTTRWEEGDWEVDWEEDWEEEEEEEEEEGAKGTIIARYRLVR